jgi:hypothetical protein
VEYKNTIYLFLNGQSTDSHGKDYEYTGVVVTQPWKIFILDVLTGERHQTTQILGYCDVETHD